MTSEELRQFWLEQIAKAREKHAPPKLEPAVGEGFDCDDEAEITKRGRFSYNEDETRYGREGVKL